MLPRRRRRGSAPCRRRSAAPRRRRVWVSVPAVVAVAPDTTTVRGSPSIASARRGSSFTRVRAQDANGARRSTSVTARPSGLWSADRHLEGPWSQGSSSAAGPQPTVGSCWHQIARGFCSYSERPAADGACTTIGRVGSRGCLRDRGRLIVTRAVAALVVPWSARCTAGAGSHAADQAGPRPRTRRARCRPVRV